MSDIQKTKEIPKIIKFSKLNEKEQKKVIENSLIKVRYELIKELDFYKSIKKYKSIDLDLYIKRLKAINKNILKYEKEYSVDSKILTTTLRGIDITFYTNFFQYSNRKGIEASLYHELQHFIKIDQEKYNLKLTKYLKTSYSKYEIITKIKTFRKYMKDNNYELSEKGIEKLFSLIEKENEPNGKNGKNGKMQNILYRNEEPDLFSIFEEFKNNKKNLLFYIKELVKINNEKINLIKSIKYS